MDDVVTVPLSALQHWAYCPRQCGLIHLEQAFDRNVHTLRGDAVHALVDDPGSESRADVRVERALPLWHDTLSLVGKADVVEFGPGGMARPVEYKHGSRNKSQDIAACDDVQVGAQAMCLEAMTGRPVPEGALFYASSKRRRTVPIDSTLRSRVTSIAREVRAMLESGVLPAPTEDERRCRGCSMKDRCQPEAIRALGSCHASLPSSPAADPLFDPDT
jgi:CRISPR-associated exonuclease Cas4